MGKINSNYVSPAIYISVYTLMLILNEDKLIMLCKSWEQLDEVPLISLCARGTGQKSVYMNSFWLLVYYITGLQHFYHEVEVPRHP